jgi:hypothetical protein
MADESAKLEEVRQEAAGLRAELSDCHPKVNQDIANYKAEAYKV